MTATFKRVFSFVILFIYLVGTKVPAQETIVFVDTNDAWGEYKAALEAARKRRPEARVVLIPPISAQNAQIRDQIEGKMSLVRSERDKFPKGSSARLQQEKTLLHLEKLAVHLRLANPQLSPQTILNELQKIRRVGSTVQASNLIPLPVPPPALTPDSLRRELQRVSQNPSPLASAIVSGHQENARHFGTLGSLSTESVGNAFKSVAPRNQSIRSIFVPGCYTCVAGALAYNWRNGFPGAQVLGGYYDKSPLGHRPEGHQYLADFLKTDKELAEAKTKEELEAAIKKIRRNGMSTSICTDRFHAQGGLVKLTEDTNKDCQDLARNKTVQKWNQTIKCYQEGLPGCEDPSRDCPRGGYDANNLRCIYARAYKLKRACENYFQSEETPYPDTEHLIRLINYKFLQRNFSVHHKSQSDSLIKAMRDLNANINWDTDKLLRGTRAEQVEFIKKAEDAIQVATEIKKDPRRLQRLFNAQVSQGRYRPDDMVEFQVNLNKNLNAAIQSISNHKRLLYYVDPQCIPSDWLTSLSREPSRCLPSRGQRP